MSIYHEQGLVEVTEDRHVSPGRNWNEFARPHEAKTAGVIAGRMALAEATDSELHVHVNAIAVSFSDAFKPPLSGKTAMNFYGGVEQAFNDTVKSFRVGSGA